MFSKILPKLCQISQKHFTFYGNLVKDLKFYQKVFNVSKILNLDKNFKFEEQFQTWTKIWTKISNLDKHFKFGQKFKICQKFH